MKLDINTLTIADVREIASLFSGAHETPWSPYEIGANYFIRTVTHHHAGRLVAVTTQELVLENASWIADDGRLTDALAKCEFAEVEMFPEGRVIVGRSTVIDAVRIVTIPTSQK